MKKILICAFVFLALTALSFGQNTENVDPTKAFDLLKSPNTYLVDVRSVAEYVFIGHPLKAVNIPLMFWNETEQKMAANGNFSADLSARFKADDVLIFMCRGGGRSQRAVQAALAAGFKNAINMTEGFEGKKDEKGIFSIGGWRGAGLPYTLDIDPQLAYKPAANK
jgi:rhodanese-related sulfurtransferase